VTFVALVDEYMIGGPSSLWVDWQEAASKFQTAKFSMSMTLRQGEICNLIDDELFPGLELNDWNYKLDLRRPIIGLTSQSNVDLLKDPMNFLFQWSQFKDGTFSACLTPEQWRHPITLLDVPEPLLVEGALSTPGESCPAAGLVATLSGGALGLGYSVTKLLS
jgi:hypothetical protein